jgi:hypothetical protein
VGAAALVGCRGGPRADDDLDLVDSGGVTRGPYPLANVCIEYAAIAAKLVPWDTLRGPLVDRPGESLSDVSVRFTVGQWHLFASRLTVATGRRDVVHLVSVDTTRWSLAEAIDVPTAAGLATPDLTRDDDGRFLLTASEVAADGVKPATWAWHSDDLSTWEAPEAFDPERGTGLERTTSAVTLGHASLGLIAMSTENGEPWVSVSRTGNIDGYWGPAAAAPPLSLSRFLRLGEGWSVLGSQRVGLAPAIAALTGDEDKAIGWLKWGTPKPLSVPTQPWNTGVPATGASLCDARGIDGFAYLFFAASDTTDFVGGHGVIGLARSRDLITWELPAAP